ncbi:HD-GYP domain-containing protein [Desulfovibrio inopinatus]|uniref:HD-GYP domain-containing protein n=1 Tax=Desulfovibrio inopinatus TaxID=102109 RepID=UPI00146FA8AF|nr:HD domain-containing phosphohydrolase [Desulfovibrio inopinatus]
MLKGEPVSKNRDDFFVISVRSILPETAGDFDLYLKRDDWFVLYASKGDSFAIDPKLTRILRVNEFYVPVSQRYEYEKYLAKNLGAMLLNEELPIEKRSEIFYNMSTKILQASLVTKMPRGLNPTAYKEMQDVVLKAVHFLSLEGTLKSVSEFVSRKYHSYTHSINVMVLAVSILQTMDTQQDELLQCGLGAVLHDIGKTLIPDEILNKAEELTEEEWDLVKTHPVRAISICSSIPLTPITTNCILFHHERYDGTGYPGGLAGEAIPFHARVMSVCDVYDSLTSDRPYAKALKPYDALDTMQGKLRGAFDSTIYKRLVYVLGNARVI